MLHKLHNLLPPARVGAPPLGDDFHRFEYRGWQKFGDAYHDAWGHVTAPFVEPMLEALGDIQDLSVLDVATGPGYGAGRALQMGAKVTGTDFSATMVRQAAMLNPGVCFEVGDVHDLPYPDCAFDCVVSNFGVQHFSEPERAFAEMARVLKPGGKLAFTLWAANIFNRAGEILSAGLNAHADDASSVPPGPDWRQLDDEAKRVEFLTRAGFAACERQSRLVAFPWALKNIDELYEAEFAGSVRSGARLREQSPDRQRLIREAMAQAINQDYRVGVDYVIPMAAHVVWAARR